jgi:hypothetical protein
MTPEEFEKIKQAEKAHLRKIRELKNTVRQLERQKKITGAISDLTSSFQQKLDVHDEMMDRIAIDSARNEARLEMAMEKSEESDERDQLARDEADLAKARSRQTIESLREKDSAPKSVVESATEKAGTPAEQVETQTARRTESKSVGSEKPDKLPEKTIGRMKP